jgi:hypothetical protein
MRRRPIALALLLWYVPACTSWHVEQGVSPQQLIVAQHPNAVRVTLPDRSQIVLHQPSNAAGDSLAGIIDGKASTVAASDVTQIATRKVSGGRTVGLVLGLGLLAATIALGVALSNMCILDC